jgi:bacterioferritin (cytochrome b1)
MTQQDAKAALIDGLQQDLSRKTYSFVEYITNAAPYITEPYEPLWQLMLDLRKEERQHARVIGQLIVMLGGIPNPMLFDESTADFNYLRIEYLAELLLRHKERCVAEFEKRVEQAAGFPEVRAVLLDLLAAEQQQLSRLRDVLDACRERQAKAANAPGSSKD